MEALAFFIWSVRLLEVEADGQLDYTWMTTEDVRSNVKISLTHGIKLTHASGSDWFDAINRTGNVLWMIERVVKICAQLNLLAAFADGEVLEDREVEILNRRQLECVASAVRQRAKPRLNVLRVTVAGEIADDPLLVGCYATTVRIERRTSSEQWRHKGRNVCDAIRIDDRPIRRRIAVEIRVNTAQHGRL